MSNPFTPTEPLSPALLEQRILEGIDLLEQATDNLAGVLLAASKAEHAWKLARAIAYRSAEGTVGEREAKVDQITEGALLERVNTEAIARAAKESLETRRTVLSALQTLLRSVANQV